MIFSLLIFVSSAHALPAYELKSPIVINGLFFFAKQIRAGGFSALGVSFPLILGENHMNTGKWHFDLARNTWALIPS